MTKIDKKSAFSVSRRGFMQGASGLTFSIAFAGWMTGKSAAAFAASGKTSLNAWVRIGTDDKVTVMIPVSEMGQGSSTGLAQILAEELDADWNKVAIETAPVDKVYENPFLHGQITVASLAVPGFWDIMRKGGAQARRVLIDNAAAAMKVPASELTTEPSMVVHAKSGRKMSYGDIAKVAKMPAKLPEIADGDLKKPEQYRIIGKPVRRLDVVAKSHGKFEYGMDVQVRGMQYAAIARTPVEGAKAEKVDDAAAKAVKGVTGVFNLGDAVGVVGTSVEATKKGKAALKITWSAGAASGFNSDKAMAEFVARANNKAEAGLAANKVGDAPGAMTGAAKVISRDYTSDYTYHAQMEPMNITAKVSPDGKSADIWAGTQAPALMALIGSLVLQTDIAKIKLHQKGLGGGFGRRIYPDLVAYPLVLSKLTQKPVKVIFSREDDVANGKLRPMTAHHIEAGLDNDNNIVSWHHRLVGQSVLANSGQQKDLEKAGGVDFLTMEGVKHKYAMPNQLVEFVREGQVTALAAWRAIGAGYNKFVIESFLDEIAHELGKDPVEFRLSMMNGDARGRKIIETVAKMGNWGTKPAGGRAKGFAFAHVWDTPTAGIIDLTVDKATGGVKAHEIWTAVNPGLVINPDAVQSQQESNMVYGLGQALTERITYTDGAIDQSNFDSYTVMRMADVPDIHVEVISTNDRPTGIGEIGLPLVGGMVANAIFNATGARVRAMPFTAERVTAAMKA